jgi:hypothetical protein
MPEPRYFSIPSVVVGAASLEERGLELDAVGAVIDPGSARLDELAGRDHRRVTEDGDQVTLAAGFDAQYTEAVLFVVESDALDEASEDLGLRASPGCLRHHDMMAIKILGRHRDQAGTRGRRRLQP